MARKKKKKLKAQIRLASKDGKVTKKELRKIAKKTGKSPRRINTALRAAKKDKDVQIPKKSGQIVRSVGVRSDVRDALKSKGSVSKGELREIAKNNPGLKANQLLKIANRVATKKEGVVKGKKQKKIIKTGQVQHYLDKFAEVGINKKELKRIFNKVGFKTTDKFFNRLDKLGADVKPGAKKKFLNKLAADTLEGKAEELAAEVDPFPGTPGQKISGEAFRKYDTQGGAIRSAAEAALEAALDDKERFKPKRLKKATTIKDEFKTGRQGRIAKIKTIEEKVKGTKPKFKDYKQNIKDIREGKSPYSYSGRFEKLGEKLGVGYGKKARKERTKERFKRLTRGLKSTYETPAVTRQRRRDLGNQAIQSLKMN